MVVKRAVDSSTIYLAFLGVKKKREGRILYRSEATSNSSARKRNTDISCTEMDFKADSIDVDTESNNVSPTLSFCDAETQTEITEEFLDRLEVELKSTGEEKDKLAKKKDELTRDSKRLQHALKNPKFGISKFKERMKISNFTLAFHTGMHLCFFTICYITRPRT
ncbi:unnamed protein product [Porites evermanni]|uniref:Uncharacterized protein n=1 Tax=Porites evermanni TaxID=104178 RepID=A0ABN8N841_9CNID|nr:unnamed protein product [Porites evermanni]